MPELEIRRDLHQLRPVGTGAVAHPVLTPAQLARPARSPPSSSRRRGAPRRSTRRTGRRRSRSASSSACSGRPLYGIGQRDAEVKAPVGKRQPPDVEAKLALARAPFHPSSRGRTRGARRARARRRRAARAPTQRRRRRPLPPRRRARTVNGSPAANCERSSPVGVEQLGRDDPSLARCPTRAGRRRAPSGFASCGEQPPVRGDRVLRSAVERDLALPQQHGAVAEALDGLSVVRDEDDRAAAILELGDLAEALALELLVADGEHLVEQQHVRLRCAPRPRSRAACTCPTNTCAPAGR